jgi:integrase
MSLTLRVRPNYKHEDAHLPPKQRRINSHSYYLDICIDGNRTREWYRDGKIPVDMPTKEKNLLIEEIKSWAFRRKENIRLEGNNMPLRYNSHLPIAPEMDKYLKNYKNKDDRKVSGAFLSFRSFMGPKARFSMVTETKLQDWIDDMDSKKLAGSTIKGYLTKVMAFLTKMHKEYFLKLDVSRLDLEKPRIRHKKKDIFNTMAEIQALASGPCTDNRIKLAALFTIFSGMEFVEIYHLRHEHIVKGVISEPRHKGFVERTVPVLFNDMMYELVALAKQYPHTEYVFDLPLRDKVYPTDRKKYDAIYNQCSAILKKWVKDSGIPQHITWHGLRHTYTTTVLGKEGRKNKALEIDQKTKGALLGHSEKSNQVQTYDHVVPDHVREAIENINVVKVEL